MMKEQSHMNANTFKEVVEQYARAAGAGQPDYKINRKHKATLFAKLFGENRENALSLYNAVNGSNYTNAEDLTYTTLDDVVYMKMKNDVSFLIDRTISLYEHQSTYNPNMPLRGFLYFADLYRQQIKNNAAIYSRYLVKIPAPKYVVFYNGDHKDMPEGIRELHLSDAFEFPVEQGKFEWTATMININPGKNAELKEKCTVLQEYTVFVEKIRSYSRCMPLTEAVDRAVDECAGEGALGRFLDKHRKKVKNMVLTEFDEEKYLEMMRAEERAEALAEGHAAGLKEGHASGIKEGRSAGLLEGLINILSDLGEIPEQVMAKAKELDADGMKLWSRWAARSDTMEAFLQKIDS
jgi:hypothetical protein